MSYPFIIYISHTELAIKSVEKLLARDTDMPECVSLVAVYSETEKNYTIKTLRFQRNIPETPGITFYDLEGCIVYINGIKNNLEHEIDLSRIVLAMDVNLAGKKEFISKTFHTFVENLGATHLPCFSETVEVYPQFDFYFSRKPEHVIGNYSCPLHVVSGNVDSRSKLKDAIKAVFLPCQTPSYEDMLPDDTLATDYEGTYNTYGLEQQCSYSSSAIPEEDSVIGLSGISARTFSRQMSVQSHSDEGKTRAKRYCCFFCSRGGKRTPIAPTTEAPREEVEPTINEERRVGFFQKCYLDVQGAFLSNSSCSKGM